MPGACALPPPPLPGPQPWGFAWSPLYTSPAGFLQVIHRKVVAFPDFRILDHFLYFLWHWLKERVFWGVIYGQMYGIMINVHYYAIFFLLSFRREQNTASALEFVKANEQKISLVHLWGSHICKPK